MAGAEANVAVGLARLGHDATYIGRVGSDGFADAIRWRLRGEGVDTTHLSADPDAPTGLMFRERRGLGPAQVVYVRRGSAGSRLTVDDVDRAAETGVFQTHAGCTSRGSPRRSRPKPGPPPSGPSRWRGTPG